MKTYEVTTQRELRRLFKEYNPQFDYRKIKNHRGDAMMYKATTRCAFVDYVDFMQKCKVISEKLADRATL